MKMRLQEVSSMRRGVRRRQVTLSYLEKSSPPEREGKHREPHTHLIREGRRVSSSRLKKQQKKLF